VGEGGPERCTACVRRPIHPPVTRRSRDQFGSPRIADNSPKLVRGTRCAASPGREGPISGVMAIHRNGSRPAAIRQFVKPVNRSRAARGRDGSRQLKDCLFRRHTTPGGSWALRNHAGTATPDQSPQSHLGIFTGPTLWNVGALTMKSASLDDRCCPALLAPARLPVPPPPGAPARLPDPPRRMRIKFHAPWLEPLRSPIVLPTATRAGARRHRGDADSAPPCTRAGTSTS